ncbi:hypothetical protein GCM10009825_13540 [Arthrobacter humicola]|uniref:Uncharacterized protein n=1 Tax=Arthrobacter humicola TaxID=409291 RepID=A0ABP5KFP0_9MICC
MVRPARGDQVGDPVTEHPGLARAGAGHDQQGAACVFHGFFLLRIQAFEKLARVRKLRTVPGVTRGAAESMARAEAVAVQAKAGL